MVGHRIALKCLVACAMLSVGACAHRAPSSAPSATTANARPSDGLSVTVSLAASDALDAAQRAVESEGFELDGSTVRRRQFRTRSRTIVGDTSMVMTLEIVPVSTTAPASVVAVSATYSTPSGRARNQHVVRAGGGDVLWRHLEAVMNALRSGREVK